MPVKNGGECRRGITAVTDRHSLPDEPTDRVISAQLTSQISAFVEALVAREEESCESEFVHLLDKVNQLVDRKLSMEGTKTDTRDFLDTLLADSRCLRWGSTQAIRRFHPGLSANRSHSRRIIWRLGSGWRVLVRPAC